MTLCFWLIHLPKLNSLHNLELAAGDIGLHVNVDKTVYMYFNQTGNSFTQNGGPLKLVDKFISLGNSVSSAENDINTWPAMALDRVLIIWKSELTNRINRIFFQIAVVSILLYGCTIWALNKRMEQKLDGNDTTKLQAVLNKSWRQHSIK